MVNVNVKVNEKVHTELLILAARQHKSLIKIVNEALKEKVQRES